MRKPMNKQIKTARHSAMLIKQQTQALERSAQDIERGMACLADAIYGVADSLDFIAAGDYGKMYISSKISGWVASAHDVANIYKKLEDRWISKNPAYTKKELEQVRKLISWLCDAIYNDMGFDCD